MNSKLQTILESIRTSVWLIPSVMVCCTTLLALLLLMVDKANQASNTVFLQFFYQVSAESSRAILTTIATSMITITSIAFSITVVALTLASSQFGPRLIRNFMSDKGTQLVLGVFVAIFIYCLLVLQATKSFGQTDFVPGLSVYFALTLAFIGVGVLIYFIHHVAHSIQADNVVEQVYCELQNNIARLFPDDSSNDKKQQPVAHLDSMFKHHCDIKAKADGYVQTVDLDTLLKLGVEYNLGFEVLVAAGDFVVNEAEIIKVFHHSDSHLPDSDNMQATVVLGSKRTPIQDPEFAIHQLVEIAVRALSPGINDPYTAISCVDKLNAMLCKLTRLQFPDVAEYDDDGILRIKVRPFTFAGLGDAAFNQIRQYAKDSIAVTIRLVDSLECVARHSQSPVHRDFVSGQLQAIEQIVGQSSISDRDRHDITKRIKNLQSTLS